MDGWRYEDLRQATRLTEYLREGGALPPLPPPVVLDPGEAAVARFDRCHVNTFVGADVHYRTIHNTALHPVGMAVHLMVHMPLNAMAKQRADREAAARWRWALSGRCIVTTSRIIVDDGRRVLSWWYGGLARTEIELGGFVLLYHDHDEPVMIDVGSPWYLAVLVYYLAWGQFIDVPEPGPEPATPPVGGMFGRRRT